MCARVTQTRLNTNCKLQWLDYLDKCVCICASVLCAKWMIWMQRRVSAQMRPQSSADVEQNKKNLVHREENVEVKIERQSMIHVASNVERRVLCISMLLLLLFSCMPSSKMSIIFGILNSDNHTHHRQHFEIVAFYLMEKKRQDVEHERQLKLMEHKQCSCQLLFWTNSTLHFFITLYIISLGHKWRDATDVAMFQRYHNATKVHTHTHNSIEFNSLQFLLLTIHVCFPLTLKASIARI